MITKALTIAGSDCSGGAGIQADLKTFAAHGVYGMSVITALTAQNTTGVYGIMDVSPEFVEKQLDAIFQDIRPDAIKIGMVSNQEIIKVIMTKLKAYEAKHIVVDPVMISTSGSQLLNNEAIEQLKKLFSLATIITPNIPEAEWLSGHLIHSKEDMLIAAEIINKTFSGSVLIKGGHLKETADDLLYHHGKVNWFHEDRIDNSNTHGTGCTLSSAIASYLSMDYTLLKSVEKAKAYITGALKENFDIGKGSGPLNHLYKNSHPMG